MLSKKIKFILLLLTSTFTACQAQNQAQFTNPKHYAINQPEVFNMPNALVEISGHDFYPGITDTIYAEQDERGTIYTLSNFKKGKAKIIRTSTFKKKGDFEDIGITGQTGIMLKSNGKLYTFPVEALKKKKIKQYKKWSELLPKGEYEGLWADKFSEDLFVLCKKCKAEKHKNYISVYHFKLKNWNTLHLVDSSRIKTSKILSNTLPGKKRFKPSAFAFNHKTQQWYIVSSINKALVITDKNWRIQNIYLLNSKIYIQPEGIAFDHEGNLYLSSEGSKLHPGKIFKIPYR